MLTASRRQRSPAVAIAAGGSATSMAHPARFLEKRDSHHIGFALAELGHVPGSSFEGRLAMKPLSTRTTWIIGLAALALAFAMFTNCFGLTATGPPHVQCSLHSGRMSCTSGTEKVAINGFAKL